MSGFAYAKQDDAVLVNMYGANRFVTALQNSPLELSQRTEYPWDGTVTLTIDRCPTQEFALKLRIPGWAEQWTLRVNDEKIVADRSAGRSTTNAERSSTNSAEPTTEGYVEIRRQWKAGDAVVLELAMPVQLLESHPLVEETRNQVAVKRGPIVYCLESPDLPSDVRVRDVAVSRLDEFEVAPAFTPLGGVAVLEAELHRIDTGGWANQLYRPIRRQPAEHKPKEHHIKTRLVPYFAWSNRGESEMSVWLPRLESPIASE